MVQEATHIPTKSLEFRDPDAIVTRLMAKHMETKPALIVDKVQPPRKQVLREDKSIDETTKATISKGSNQFRGWTRMVSPQGQQRRSNQQRH